MINIELTWVSELVSAWEDRIRHGRTPHAIMLLGPPGVGKRCMAAWLAQRHLGSAGEALPRHPLTIPPHADLRWLRPPEDKSAIGIDSVRELVADLGLTSYSGRGKVAVIEPADAMTGSAANSLLKTLEEPPGNALLILVVDRAGRLPATIVSRCQRVDFCLPPVSESLAWLDRIKRSDHWPAALAQSGGAPLRAILELERLEITESVARDFVALAGRTAMPVEIAARWARLDTEFVLEWLSRRVQDCIRRAMGGKQQDGIVVLDSVLHRMDRRKLFCYLDMINGIRRQAAGSYNVQLTLESLLIEWADGLHGCQPAGDASSLQLNFAR